MADWVAYTRVEGSEPTPGQTTSNIDNCCFVDRQCHTDQDWTDGYWAFQNNQCPAPAQSLTPTSSQPVSGAPAQIDNCCFVDRQCSSDQDWINGYHAYQNNQCGAPGQSPASASSQSASGRSIRTAGALVIGSAGGRSILPSTRPLPRAPSGKPFLLNMTIAVNTTGNATATRIGRRAIGQYQSNLHCALPGLISIVGDPDFVDFYAQRLDQLKNRLPQRYDYVLNGLSKIQQGTGMIS